MRRNNNISYVVYNFESIVYFNFAFEKLRVCILNLETIYYIYTQKRMYQSTCLKIKWPECLK